MNYRLVILPIFLLILLSACSDKNDQSKIVAIIGDHEISIDQFEERYSKFIFETGVSDKMLTRKSILDDMINELLLFYYDDNESIFTQPEYQKEINWLKKQALLAYLKDQEIYAKITASDEEARLAFQRVSMQISARHLYSNTQEEANKLYELLQIGVSFEQLAKQVFTDSELQNNGGYLGYFTWGDMDPAFEEAVYSMKIGEISKPIQLEQGYSIVKVEDKIFNPLLTEDEFIKKKSKFEHVVKINKKRQSEKEYINRVLDFSKISLDQKLVSEIYNDRFGSNLDQKDESLKEDKIVIEYLDKNYTVKEINDRLDEVPVYHQKNIKSSKHFEIVLKGIVLQDELVRISTEKGYIDNPKVIAAYNRLEMNNFQKFKRIEIARETSLSDSVVKAYFEHNKAFFSTHDEINVREILVESKDLSDSIYAEISAGADFAKLSKKYSLRKSSADNGGELGFAPRSKFGQLNEEFWNAPLNKVIGPYKIADLYGVFEVLGKKNSRPLEFDEIKNDVEVLAKFEKQKEMYQNYLENLRVKQEIIVNELVLGTIVINTTDKESV